MKAIKYLWLVFLCPFGLHKRVVTDEEGFRTRHGEFEIEAHNYSVDCGWCGKHLYRGGITTHWGTIEVEIKDT